MPEINNEYNFTSVTELEYDEYEEGPGDDGPTEYLSDYEDSTNTQDGIPSWDNNRSGGKLLAVWDRYKNILEHDYSRSEYMMYVDSKEYEHAKVSALYIYVNYHIIFLQIFILKRI